MDLAVNKTNLKSIRVIRVLQPLRNITRFEKLKNLANTLIKSLPNFAKVGIFLVMIFVIFGIFGLQMHYESFYWRCRVKPEPETIHENGISKIVWEIDEAQRETLCTGPEGLGLYHCVEGTYCGNPYHWGLDASFDDV